MNQFGNKIRELRELHKIKQREIAAFLSTDTAMISKMEKGTRQPKREQVIALASFLKTDKEELLSLWLADKVYDLVKGEEVAIKSLKSAEKQIDNTKRS